MERVKRFFAHWCNGAVGSIANVVGIPGYSGDAKALITNMSGILVLAGVAILAAHATAVLFNNGNPYRRWWQRLRWATRGVEAYYYSVDNNGHRLVRSQERVARLRIGRPTMIEFCKTGHDKECVLFVRVPSDYRLTFKGAARFGEDPTVPKDGSIAYVGHTPLRMPERVMVTAHWIGNALVQ